MNSLLQGIYIIAHSVWQLYRIESLHPPGRPMTVAVLRTMTKLTHCINQKPKRIKTTNTRYNKFHRMDSRRLRYKLNGRIDITQQQQQQ